MVDRPRRETGSILTSSNLSRRPTSFNRGRLLAGRDVEVLSVLGVMPTNHPLLEGNSRRFSVLRELPAKWELTFSDVPFWEGKHPCFLNSATAASTRRRCCL